MAFSQPTIKRSANNKIAQKIFLFVATMVAMMSLSTQTHALNLPTIELSPGSNANDLATKLRYVKNYQGAISYHDVISNEQTFSALEAASIQFGRASSSLLILLKIKNVGDTKGEWIFSTGRGSATMLKIFHLTPHANELRFDSDNFKDAKEVLWTYLHYASEVSLQPQQEVIIAVHSNVEDSSYFPLELKDRDKYSQASNFTMMLAAGCTAAILALLILNLFFYLSTGRPEFVWLVAAEFFLATVVMYLVGFLSTYLFYDLPMWGLIFGDITKYAYVACMAQFARVFIDTKYTLPRVEVFLKFLIGISVLMIAIQLFSHYIPLKTRISLHAFNYLIVAASAFYFTYLGIYATRKVGAENWPLIVAWGSLAIFAIYAACAYSGVVPNLPMNFYVIAPVAVIEAAFATLALGLNIRAAQVELDSTKEKYLASLQDKLKLSISAQKLAEEKSAALSTVVDQSALLHASGHDSQQVLLALNSVLEVVKSPTGPTNPKEFENILSSSAGYLDKIIASTLSGARIGNSNINVLALSSVSLREIIDPLEMMYRQLFQRKGLRLRVDSQEDIVLITDRALLTRALSNLLSNSHKFTEQGGVEISIHRENNWAVLELHDTGSGVAADLIDKLNSLTSDRVRGTEETEGSGSGYRYAQRIVTQLQGRLSISSNSSGTQVCMKLPIPTSLTQCKISDLRLALPNAEFEDHDKATKLRIERRNEQQHLIAVSYDESASTRQKLQNTFDTILYKPLVAEFALFLSK